MKCAPTTGRPSRTLGWRIMAATCGSQVWRREDEADGPPVHAGGLHPVRHRYTKQRSFRRSRQRPVLLQRLRNKSAFPCLLARTTSQSCLPVQCGTPLHATDLVAFRKLGRSHYFPLFESSSSVSTVSEKPSIRHGGDIFSPRILSFFVASIFSKLRGP